MARSRPWWKRIGYRLPLIGRLKRQRDSATLLATRLHAIMTETAGDRGFLVKRHGDLKLILDPSSLVDRVLIDNGDWEPRQIAAMVHAARSVAADSRRKLFLDVGALWGLYALSMWRLSVFSEIHCFEPDRHNFAQLAAEVFANRASYDITLHNVAALEAPMRVRQMRSLSIEDGNRGSAAITDDAAAAEMVSAVRLDDVIAARDAIVFIKLDVERSEARALAGMQAILANNDVYLQVERLPEGAGDLSALLPPRLIKRGVIDHDHVYASFDVPGLPG